MTNSTYLTETTSTSDQKTSEAMPRMSPRVGFTTPPSSANTVWIAYSGLVPMSPKTTPSAPSVSPVASAGRRRSARERLRAVAVAAMGLLVGGADDHDLAGGMVEQPGDVAGVQPVTGGHHEPVEPLVGDRLAHGVAQRPAA